MPEPKILHKGDPCPNCGGELKAAPFPSEEQYAASRDRENPIILPRHFDSATIAQRRELGELARCACGYVTRYSPDEAPRARASASSKA